MGELNPWEDAEWVVAIVESNALRKNGVVITGSPFVHLVPVTGHRAEEVKTTGISIGDLAISAGPPMSFGAFKLDVLIEFAFKHGYFTDSEARSMRGREPDARVAECGNCEWKGRVDQLGCQMWDIPDFFERVAEGEICPVGECPECEALARLIHIPSTPYRGCSNMSASGTRGQHDVSDAVTTNMTRANS